MPPSRRADRPELRQLPLRQRLKLRLGHLLGAAPLWAVAPSQDSAAPLWAAAPSQDIVTQGWGCTDYNGEWYAPWCPGGYYHAGIDLGYSGGGNATCGKPVYATRSGLVVAVGADGEGNSGFSEYLGPNAVCIHYDDGMYVEHGHLGAAHVSVGQRVDSGAHIGDIGTLGASSACHLHVEARVDGPYQGVASNAANVRDPRPYLNPLPAPAPAPSPSAPASWPFSNYDLTGVEL